MFDTFKQDIQRWIVPGSIASRELVTIGRTFRLLLRYKPLRAMVWFQLGSWCSQHRIRLVPSLMMWILITFYGLDISIGPDYGGGLYIPHPVGMVITPARIGQNCSSLAAITIGMRNEHAFAVIGANVVVIKDVPPGATVVGVPAQVVRINIPPGTLVTAEHLPANTALENSSLEQVNMVENNQAHGGK